MRSKGEDWAAISVQLKKIGDHTSVVRSSGGYYAIYRADRIYGGTFNSWEDFINYYESKDVTFGLTQKTANFLGNIIGWFGSLLNPKAYAVGCSVNKPYGPENDVFYEPVEIQGRITDSVTGLALTSGGK